MKEKPFDVPNVPLICFYCEGRVYKSGNTFRNSAGIEGPTITQQGEIRVSHLDCKPQRVFHFVACKEVCPYCQTVIAAIEDARDEHVRAA